LQLAIGAGLLLAGLDQRSPLPAIALVAIGVALAWPALRRLLPTGTLTARPGLPAGLAVHALLNFAYFTAEAFLPLGLILLRGFTATEAGLALTTAALTWTAGAWLQARLDARAAGRGRRRRVLAGFLVILLGGAVMAAVVLTGSLPTVVAVIAWGLAALGMGIAYPTVVLILLAYAPEGQEGAVSGSLRVVEALSVAVGAGLGGAGIALTNNLHWAAHVGIAIAFGLALAASILGFATAWRLESGHVRAETLESAAASGAA
jgi:MFS family permease